MVKMLPKNDGKIIDAVALGWQCGRIGLAMRSHWVGNGLPMLRKGKERKGKERKNPKG